MRDPFSETLLGTGPKTDSLSEIRGPPMLRKRSKANEGEDIDHYNSVPSIAVFGGAKPPHCKRWESAKRINKPIPCFE